MSEFKTLTVNPFDVLYPHCVGFHATQFADGESSTGSRFFGALILNVSNETSIRGSSDLTPIIIPVNAISEKLDDCVLLMLDMVESNFSTESLDWVDVTNNDTGETTVVEFVDLFASDDLSEEV